VQRESARTIYDASAMSTAAAESIAKVARKNPVAKRTWWIAGLTGLAAVAIGGIAYAATRKTAASQPPPPANQLTPGHRYGFTLACPTALPPPLPTDNASAQTWFGVPGVTVVSYKQTSPNSVALMFDYKGTVAIPLPPIQASGATACRTQLSDMGVSP
jgi:hypothetical protein